MAYSFIFAVFIAIYMNVVGIKRELVSLTPVVSVLLPRQCMGGMPKIGAQSGAVIIDVEVGYSMVIIGSGPPRELTLLENEKAIKAT